MLRPPIKPFHLLTLISRYFKNTSPLKNAKGVALLQTLFLVMLIIFIVNQVNFEAAVEYTVNSQSLHRIKAYQAARSGVDISLLRINIYNKVMKQFGKQLGDQAQVLNMIYSFPLTWPMVIPGEVSSVEKDSLNKINKESLMDSTFATQIQSEDFLNINDLGSPIESQRERVKIYLQELFKGKMETDKEWVEANRGMPPYDEIINNIKDWIDPDIQSDNGGDEKQYYSRLQEMDPDNKSPFPPNRFFRTIDEIRMVPGVTDAVFDLISPGFSVFGPMGINPNLADMGAIKSLHKTITDEIAGKILNRREQQDEGGPYKDAEDFFNYANREGARISQEEQEKIPLRFTNPCNFRIQSTGSSGKTAVTITAVTYDISCAQAEVSAGLKKDKPKGDADDKGEDPSNPPPDDSKDQTKDGSSPQQALPKGPPRIVYWNEK